MVCVWQILELKMNILLVSLSLPKDCRMYLTQELPKLLQEYLPNVLAHMVTDYAISRADLIIEMYLAIRDCNLDHIKRLEAKDFYNPNVGLPDKKYLARMALQWQQFNVFDYFLPNIGLNDKEEFAHIQPIISMEFFKRVSLNGPIDASKDQPNLINSINTDVLIDNQDEQDTYISDFIEYESVHSLYAILYRFKSNLTEESLDRLNNYTKPANPLLSSELMMSAIVCHFLGVDMPDFIKCQNAECIKQANGHGQWCNSHDPNIKKCDYVFKRGGSVGQMCGKIATNNGKCALCSKKK